MAERRAGRLELLVYLASTALVTWATLDDLGWLARHPWRPAAYRTLTGVAYRAAAELGQLGMWAERRYYQEVRR